MCLEQGAYHNRFFFVSSPGSASLDAAPGTGCRSPASARPPSAHFLAETAFHQNLAFGDSTRAHPRSRIGFRREFLPRTSAVHSTNHNHFPDTWSFSFSRNVTLSANRVPPSPSETPCKQEPFAPRSLPASSLLRLHPTPAPLLAQGQVSQVPVQNFRNAPCPYAPSRRARRKTTSARPCWLPLS